MYLLDTCAFIWALSEADELSQTARSIIQSGKTMYLSQVSLWEIAIKKTINKLKLEETTAELETYCREGNIVVLPVKNEYFDIIQELPYHHGDPFDRIIIATAVQQDLTVLTSDNQFKKYSEIKVLW